MSETVHNSDTCAAKSDTATSTYDTIGSHNRSRIRTVVTDKEVGRIKSGVKKKSGKKVGSEKEVGKKKSGKKRGLCKRSQEVRNSILKKSGKNRGLCLTRS